MSWVVISWNTDCRSASRASRDLDLRNSTLWARYCGRATSVSTCRFLVLRKARPALRWTFHSSPSELMMPWPVGLGKVGLHTQSAAVVPRSTKRAGGDGGGDGDGDGPVPSPPGSGR
jgi:hypothetical protein